MATYRANHLATHLLVEHNTTTECLLSSPKDVVIKENKWNSHKLMDTSTAMEQVQSTDGELMR